MCNCKKNKVEVRFKKIHELAKLPSKNKDSDTGYDVYSIEKVVIPTKGCANIKCGLQVAYITPGYWFSARSRSGLGFKNDIICFHGTIDNEYRGELGLKLFNFSDKDYIVNVGDRVCQIAIQENIDSLISFSDDIAETERGSCGFGSSGK